MKFSTRAVLTVSTGRFLGDMKGLYAVISFLIGRSAYTHELGYYGRAAGVALKAALPDLPTEADVRNVTGQNYQEFVHAWESKFGAEVAEEMAPGRVIVVDEHGNRRK